MFFRDAVAGNWGKCLDCGGMVLKPKRKCNRCRKPKTHTVVLRDSHKGRNARGTCLHKADKVRTKRAKRQNPQSRTNVIPYTRKSNWSFK